MAKLPEHESPTVAAIYDRYRRNASEGPRSHLGASQIGRECLRALWYDLRWVTDGEAFPGRILRLFETGNIEEDRLINDLRAIGVTVECRGSDGRQFGFVDHGGHFAGSVDGVVLGIPEAPLTWHLLECKTSNDKHFAELVQYGVKQAKPEHYAQMITYMDYLELERALYLAVNKNTDEIYSERIHANPNEAARLRDKAERIIFAARPLPGISADPAWFKCKFCDHRAVCHERRPAAVNCRTCLHSTPIDGGWSCERHKKALSYNEQLAGCPDHLYIPELVPAAQVDAGDGFVEYESDCKVFRNGKGGLSSVQIRNEGIRGN